jgi:ribosomal protein S18 acetylase RimI-like enzyme
VEVNATMIDYEVRRARPGECPAVGALTAAGYRADGLLSRRGGTDHYEAELLDAAGRAAAAQLLVAAEPRGRLLGTVTWCPPGSGLRELATRPEQGEFRMLAVAPATRRRGIARALVQHCLAEAHRLGLAELVLSSLPEMAAAHALYTALGFRRAPELDWNPVPPVRLWAFRLVLRPSAATPGPGQRATRTAPRLVTSNGTGSARAAASAAVAGARRPRR